MKTMPRQRFTLRELCLMTFLAVFGMLFKPLVSPAFNLITDFVRVPGGSMTAGFSLLFLVFAAARRSANPVQPCSWGWSRLPCP